MKGRKQNEKDNVKKACYANYGIEYKSGKILSPMGYYIPELLKEGNTKTGKKVYTFSLLPGSHAFEIEICEKIIDEVINETITVYGTCICDCTGCYAKTGNYRYNSTIHSLGINTYLVNNHLDFVYRCIKAQLEYIGQGEVRIHAAGDFNTYNSYDYANMWYTIAKNTPSFIFWTYTKIKKYETLFDDLENANIVKSIIPGIGINYGHCDYIINAYYTLKSLNQSVYICKCGIDENQHCENCKVCATYKYVLFIEHSTGYNAKKDPLYTKLCKIIENQ